MRRHVGLQYERHGSTAGSGIRFEWRLYRPTRAPGRQRSTMLRRRTILQEPKEFPGPFRCAGRSAACALRIGSILATRSLVDCAVADIDNSPFGMPSGKTSGHFRSSCAAPPEVIPYLSDGAGIAQKPAGNYDHREGKTWRDHLQWK